MIIWSIVPIMFFAAIFYIGRRGRQAFIKSNARSSAAIYWAVYLLWVCSYIFSRTFTSGLSGKALAWVGSYSLAFIYYAFFILILIDIVRLLDHWLGFVPEVVKRSPAKVGVMVVILLMGLLAYGTWNALNPVFTSYNIEIPKSGNDDQPLHAIMISDLHLGNIVNNERLEKLVEQINQRHPDIILLAGDVIDGNIQPFIDQNMGATLLKLKPGLGTYMVLGNHDGDLEEISPYLQAAGITVLSNQYQLINNSFYLLGRDYGHYGSESNRPALAKIMAGINKERPIIFLNHCPTDLEEARSNGVDLQLSGHTHQGQLFPNNFITARMYAIDWGYMRQGNLQVIVSTGFGTWGPPIRIGNTPEIVDLTINFQP